MVGKWVSHFHVLAVNKPDSPLHQNNYNCYYFILYSLPVPYHLVLPLPTTRMSSARHSLGRLDGGRSIEVPFIGIFIQKHLLFAKAAVITNETTQHLLFLSYTVAAASSHFICPPPPEKNQKPKKKKLLNLFTQQSKANAPHTVPR